MAIQTIPPTYYQIAFNADPNQALLPPWWTDQSWRVQFPWDTSRGRQYELDAVETGEWHPVLANPDGALDPSNTASPYYPNVLPYRQARIICRPGVNQLTPDQASAGQASGFLGQIPARLNVGNDFGYPVTIVTSGTAFEGSQVYQAVLPSSAGAFTTVLIVTSVPVVPGAAYSLSAQVRIPSGTTMATNAAILWFDNNGTPLTPAAGAAVTPTSGSATWNAVTASGAAPSTAYSASLKIQIAAGSTAAPTTWQIDGLQWERSAAATPYQAPQNVGPNLLPQAMATATASLPSGASPSTAFYSAAGTLAQATGLTATPTGQSIGLAWTTPSGTTSSTPLYAGVATPGAPAPDGAVADCVQVTAGLQYTASMYVSRLSSADATVQVMAGIRWLNAAGLVAATNGTATTVTVGSWTRVTVTAFAPAGALWGRPRFFISTPASTTAANTIYSASWQFEQAASASAWLDPGPTYSVMTPFIERWPQIWDEQAGTYGTSPVIGDDAFAALSQYTLLDPLIEEILALNPNFLYALSDAAGSTSCADKTGKRSPAPIENSSIGAGSLTLGNSVTATSTPGLMLGTAGPVATFNNPVPNPSPQTFISLHKTTTKPGPPTTGGWTRMIAFRSPTTPPPTDSATIWFGSAPTYSSDQSGFSLALNGGTGVLNFAENGPAGQPGPFYNSASSVCDGNWHLAAFQFEGNGYFDVYLDGAQVYRDNNSGAGWVTPTNQVSDVLGSLVALAPGVYGVGYAGDLAMAAEFPTALTAAQHANLYNSFRSASSGESSGTRVQRLLKWIGWTGPSAIDTGQTTSMGPATDLTGATALDAANNIALTENGNWYAAASGALTFKSRTARYNQLTPQYVFGERTALGEWPFETPFQFDDDTSHIANNVQITQFSPGTVTTAIDAASGQRYFPRVYQRTINTTSAPEAQDAANYLLGQYKDAHMRVSALRLHPSAMPGLFLACLNLELGTRIRINRRPSGGAPITFDGFVEKIDWDWDPQGDVFVNLQCSPADLARYWLVGATRTTLNVQATSGTNTATINALPDAAVNALASSLPQGYQLVFEPGTVRQETMTLTATGIPATSPGWQTATLTFTANFAFTHPANSVVCEPLPTGVTDPTTWDAVSMLGASSCQVVSGGASGTNTITVGPLGDAKTNPLGSDWNTGDLIWISPGTSAFEGYNILTPNQATAGESVFPLAAGTNGNLVGVGSALGTASVTASGTAFQGSNVWQVPIGASASLFRLLRVMLVPATPGLAHTWSAYVRSATTGANPTLHAQIIYLDSTGNGTLATVNGAGATLTGSPTAAWTRVAVTATAPAGTVFAALGIPLDATAPSSAWTFQGDALQWEANGSASPFCATPQIKSVAASVAGYSSVQITLNTNLINNHAAGDFACDPLPPGDTNPTQAAGTARIAY